MMHIIESPRDAMQGYGPFIPTADKARYLNAILKANFDIVDIGSLVSPRAIPQLRDSKEVYQQLDLQNTKSKLMMIVANERGAKEAAALEKIDYLGLPLSTSAEFLKRNINTDISGSLKRAESIKNICDRSGKKLILYISMAFGNPYNEPWRLEELLEGTQKFIDLGIDFINYSDTVGLSEANQVSDVFAQSRKTWPDITFGFHLHIRQGKWKPQIDAAWKEGCRWFDGVLSGLGGCPMTGTELVGNLPTHHLLDYAHEHQIPHQTNLKAVRDIDPLNREIFGGTHTLNF